LTGCPNVLMLSVLQDIRLGNRTLVSPVLGSSVTNLSISNLREHIQFSIRGPYNTQVRKDHTVTIYYVFIIYFI